MTKIKIGISQGDINGISYEIMTKTFSDKRVMDGTTPIIFGLNKIASQYHIHDNISEFKYNLIKEISAARDETANLINLTNKDVPIQPGKSTPIAGELALESLKQAVISLQKKEIDVLLTCPINKHNMQSESFSFPGHTEYLTDAFGKHKSLMLMIGEGLRIGVITGHIALKEVPEKLSQELILSKIRILNRSLMEDFAIIKPKIALLSLNPHAGEEGLFGDEEQKIISPAIEQAIQENILAFGPFPADGFFGSSNYTKFDGILAMYHDQGLIPFKALCFDNGVNYTAGLPFIRTSPAHGTAYDIAGKNIASEKSFRAAFYLARDIFFNRKNYADLRRNPIKA